MSTITILSTPIYCPHSSRVDDIRGEVVSVVGFENVVVIDPVALFEAGIVKDRLLLGGMTVLRVPEFSETPCERNDPGDVEGLELREMLPLAVPIMPLPLIGEENPRLVPITDSALEVITDEDSMIEGGEVAPATVSDVPFIDAVTVDVTEHCDCWLLSNSLALLLLVPEVGKPVAITEVALSATVLANNDAVEVKLTPGSERELNRAPVVEVVPDEVISLASVE